MKRFVKGVCLMGTVALLAVSCNKQKTNSKVYSVRMDATEERFNAEKGLWDDEEPSRIYINGDYHVAFEAGDELMLFNIDETTPSNSQSAVYTVSQSGEGSGITLENLGGTGISDEIMDAKYAFYPGGNVAVDLSNQNRATFTLDATQTYREVGGAPVIPAGALYMAAKIDKAGEGQLQNDQFAMRNICGILQLQFYSTEENKTVSSIVLENGGEMNITGDVNLKIPAVNPGTMTMLFTNIVDEPDNVEFQEAIASFKGDAGYNVTNAGNTITLTNVNKTLSTDRNNPDSFYFVLRPLALKDGFSVTINFTDNTSKTITSTKQNTNTIKPNTFRTFAPMKANL